jgi:hypothetical protein
MRHSDTSNGGAGVERSVEAIRIAPPRLFDWTQLWAVRRHRLQNYFISVGILRGAVSRASFKYSGT